jgi:hypothetical protein
MRRVILTSSSGLCLILANRADMVVPLIFRFVSGPLPTPGHLDSYFMARSFKEQTHWSDFAGRHSRAGLTHNDVGLFRFCEKYGVDLIELWFDPSPNDQLQLIWILDYMRLENLIPRLRLRLGDFDLGERNGRELRALDVRDVDVTGRRSRLQRWPGKPTGRRHLNFFAVCSAGS